MNSNPQQEPGILHQLTSDEAVDPEVARILLNRFFGVFLAVAGFMLLFGIAFVFPNKLASAIAILPLLGITLWAWQINQKGYPQRAASLFAVLIWVLGTVSLFKGLPASCRITFDGIRSNDRFAQKTVAGVPELTHGYDYPPLMYETVRAEPDEGLRGGGWQPNISDGTVLGYRPHPTYL